MTVSLVIIQGDAVEQMQKLPAGSAHCCVTSPPYWGLRDYGVKGQLGLEKTPEEYVSKMVAVFREVWRVLRDDGTLWLNLGDSYAYNHNRGPANGANKNHHEIMPKSDCGLSCTTLKPKDLCGIHWRVAFALQADGWYLRSDIIWHKPNPMPESVTDRPTKAHEYIFLLSKSQRYFYDHEAIKEPVKDDSLNKTEGQNSRYHKSRDPQHTREYEGKTRKARKPAGWDTGKGSHSAFHRDGRAQQVEYYEIDSSTRNKRSVWTVATHSYKEAHFATYPPDLIKPCILAGCPAGGTVLDPFAGSGTTGQVALELGRKAILIELNPEYITLIRQRCDVTPGLPLC